MDALEYVEAYGTMAVGTLSALGMLLEGLLPGDGVSSSIFYMKNGVTVITLIACAIALPGYDSSSVAYYAMGYFFALVLTALATYSRQVYEWWVKQEDSRVHWFALRWIVRLVSVASIPLPSVFLIRHFYAPINTIFSTTKYFANISGALPLLLIVVFGSLSCMIWLVIGVYLIWTEASDDDNEADSPEPVQQVAIDPANPRPPLVVVAPKKDDDQSDDPRVNPKLGYSLYANLGVILCAFWALMVYTVVRRNDYIETGGPVDQCFEPIDEEELLTCVEYQRIGHLWVLVASQFLPVFARLGDH